MRKENRKKLKEHYEKLVNEKSYEYLIKQKYPIVYDEVFEGEEATVEIQLLELKEEYIHLSIDVADAGISSYFNTGVGCIIYKDKSKNEIQ